MRIYKTSIKLVRETTTQYNNTNIKNITDIIKLIDNIEDIKNNDVENAYIICLNNKNVPVNYSLIAKGTINASMIDPKTIFKTILLSNASSFIMVHNHPSGDPTPSKQDYEITNILKKASKLLDINFLDHIIIGNNNYISCMEV
jgi:DNA repair protein RadC